MVLMSTTLACCWAFAPWRHEAATTAAAWLTRSGATSLDVLRADLDARLPRETPRPAIDGQIARARSLRGGAMPVEARAVEAYAAAGLATAADWAADSGPWDQVYSGPMGLADHALAASVRADGLAGQWVAHVDPLPTHGVDGARLTAEMDRALAARVLPLLPAAPDSPLVADWILALIAQADVVLAGTEAAAQALGEHPAFATARPAGAPPVVVWQRPGLLASPAYDQGPGVLSVAVDAHRLPRLEPVLAAYAMLRPQEQAKVPLRIRTNDPRPVGAALRRRGLEPRVEIAADPSPAARLAGTRVALVVDAPPPEGARWSPAGMPELADYAAAGIPVVVLAEQDSPWSALPGVTHLPSDHPSAALAVLRALADA